MEGKTHSGAFLWLYGAVLNWVFLTGGTLSFWIRIDRKKKPSVDLYFTL